ncbi:hypothetical protein HQN87_15560 [Paenibacillus tritici]|uniref:DUF4367 domain-containing protein n=1 Tax=Paenibacillus tritici TaxID=1873425 RepID=A0ABX2DQ52_9BACL|nr:hypothetical protein [Paenibacillus tritici]NQX46755.1 hypothetical protein [Paenibacillus tritici]
MDRTGISDEYQDIKAAAVGGEQFPLIEVTDRVMARVRDSGQQRSPRGIRLAGRTAAFSGVLVMLLLVAVTAYAATEYIQIRNHAGEVKVQHVAENPNPGESAPYSQYASKLMDSAKPGELIAYFVRGEKLPEGAKSALQYAGKELRLTDYSAFLGEMNKRKTPVLPKEAGGYVFKSGTIVPGSPSDKEYDTNPLYGQTLDELTAEARQNTGRNLFMKAIPWTEVSSVGAKYTRQGAVIELSATLMHGGPMQVMQPPGATAEKLTVEGREMVHNLVSRPEVQPGFSYHYLNWYNEQQDTYYTATTYGDRELTKEQLLDLVGELIRGGL